MTKLGERIHLVTAEWFIQILYQLYLQKNIDNWSGHKGLKWW